MGMSADSFAQAPAADLLFDKAAVRQAIGALAQTINKQFAERELVVLCVMNGGLVFCGELLTGLTMPVQLGYVHASRYRGQTEGGQLQWLQRPTLDLSGKQVLIVDDILDEGVTLAAIIAECTQLGARSVSSAVLVEKIHDRRVVDVEVEFIGLQVPDRYVFGYGMDYDGRCRNLPGIYALAK